MEATAVVASNLFPFLSSLPSKRSLAAIGRLSFSATGTAGYSRRTTCREAVPFLDRKFCAASRVGMEESSGFSSHVHTHIGTCVDDGKLFFRNVISNMEKVYLIRNSTARAILDLVRSHDGNQICYDHFAFRTFGVDGYGIDSISKFFTDYGYIPCDELRFPAKKLKAMWFSPPDIHDNNGKVGSDGPLPRIFISELCVEELSSQSKEVIRKYTEKSNIGKNYASLASSLGSLTWQKPSYSDFQLLARESEYAAWTLVNGYAVNHVTISTHRLKSEIKSINNLNHFIEESGFKLNSEGGVLKVSPDGLLLQSSTVADSISFEFADREIESIPCSYIEFAERLLLPEFKDLAEEEVKEFHRRDGFEVGNADKIFESTSKEQLTRNAPKAGKKSI